jgi:S-DNA-T family DNA segregation ATPase FtsK/SpoIIIE
MRKKLELQADRIEEVLSLFKVPARVTGGTVTPRWVRFQVLPALGAKMSRIKSLHEEMAAALNAPTCRISRRGAAVAIEIPRDDPQPVRLLPLFHQLYDDPNNDLKNKSYIIATIGLAEDGSPLLIRLPSPDVAHILVAGTTGSGKTVLLQAIILSLAMSERPDALSLVLIDPKGSAFSAFKDLPHLARLVVTQIEETVETLQSLVHLMERRSKVVEPKPHIVLVIDELADLLLVGGKPVQWALTRLTQRGRGAAIHVIAATQKPVTSAIGTLVKANFPVRLVGHVMSTEDARVATGLSGSSAERLLGRGDFLAVAEGRVMRFQVAHVTPQEIQAEVAKMPAVIPLSIPVNTPAHLRTIQSASPVLTLPVPLPQIDDNRTMANRLIQSHLWSQRYEANCTTYRWGWMTKACAFLFNRPLAGAYDQKTRQAIALAETISSTTTTHEAPGEGPRGGPVQLTE